MLREWRGSCNPGPISPQGLMAEVTVCSRPGGSRWGRWEPWREDASLARSVSAHVVTGAFCPGPSAATVGRADRQACLVRSSRTFILMSAYWLGGVGGSRLVSDAASSPATLLPHVPPHLCAAGCLLPGLWGAEGCLPQVMSLTASWGQPSPCSQTQGWPRARVSSAARLGPVGFRPDPSQASGETSWFGSEGG